MNRICLLLLLTITSNLLAQEKQPLNHDVYDSWKDIEEQGISRDGKFIKYAINPQEGDGLLIITDNVGNVLSEVPRAKGSSFSYNSQFLVAKIAAQHDTVRAQKLAKVKKDKLPKDSLLIINLEDQRIEKVARVKNFEMPEKASGWLAYQLEKPIKEKKEPVDTTELTIEERATLDSLAEKKPEGSKLVIKNLQENREFTVDNVRKYEWAQKEAKIFFVLQNEEDSLKDVGIFSLNLENGERILIDSAYQNYGDFGVENNGRSIAFLATEDSAKATYKVFSLFLAESGKEAVRIVDTLSSGMRQQWMVSEHIKPRFSEDGNKLFFGTAPSHVKHQYAQDTTILDEERVSLDIWSHHDEDLQPMQLVNQEKDRQKQHLAVYHIKDKKLIQLGDETLENVVLDKDARLEKILATDNSAYKGAYSWDIQIGRDVYIVDLKSGDRQKISEAVKGYPSLSPEGNFVSWFDQQDSTWVIYDIKQKKANYIAKELSVNFYIEDHDSPSLPGSYGEAGWLKDDNAFLVYDKYDVWQFDPKGKKAPTNLTDGKGRADSVQYRVQKLDREKEYLDSQQPLILTAFHENNKKAGYARGKWQGAAPETIVFSDHYFSSFEKAELADNILLRRSTFQEFPELYTTQLSDFDLKQITETNPQQSDYLWGSAELTSWNAADGQKIQGLLFKPENFDPSKQYPMMVYFYEKNSDGLHRYRAPAPSASIINISYFVSNDYLVFVPDIVYERGLPGPSAYNCIVPGVLSMIDKGFVDNENIAIQGQSWGGYQVAHLVTRTNMFKAAGAGAPVANMTSAYGGIRWGTGMSRMFQYEQTQSRIGGTLWEKPMLYIENSPLFYADRIETPVLIMHNDKDGSVPWYQGIEFFMALKRNEVPTWLLVYNGEDHNLKLRKNRKDLSIRLSQYFDHYLKGAPAPAWMEEGLPATEKGKTLKYELMD